MSIMPSTQTAKPPFGNNAMADLLCSIMILCRGTDEHGDACWAYMCIKPSMARAFKEAREKGMFDLEDFGTILESGGGEEPSEHIKRRMERDYGMNHGYEDSLLEAVKKIENQDRF